MTSPEGTKIYISLHTGELSGIRIAELPYVSVQAIFIPRDRLGEAKQHIQNRLAVYFLLDTVERTVYIGQTDDAWERISYHNNTKNWWRTAVVLVSQTEHGLSLDDIKWLEWQCIKVAKKIERRVTKDAGSFQLDNAKEPDEPSISNSMRGAMRRLFDSLCTLVSVLGYPVFQPEEDADPKPAVGTPSLAHAASTGTFCCAAATGAFGEGGFIVRKDSTARLGIAPHAVKTVGRKRKQLLDEGVLVEEGGGLRFVKDHKFNSPSGAAAVVLGRSADGWIEWENGDGKPLGEIVRRGGPEQADRTIDDQAEDTPMLPRNDTPPSSEETKGPERVQPKELIDAGILKAGQELRKKYKGDALKAELLKSGGIQFNGALYSSPSGAAKAATGNPTDGWHFWQYQDKDGNWVLLDVARQAYCLEHPARKGK
jgi:hypothetical protein